MKKKNIVTLFSVYAVIMLLILVLSVVFLLRNNRQKPQAPAADTEYIYIYVTAEESQNSTETEAPQLEGWIVRAYSEQIGIFKADGTLLRVLDTYIKTLPKADQHLLGEGIYVQTREQLNALIEDYTD